MNRTTLPGIATFVLLAAHPLLASEGETPVPGTAISPFATVATELSVQPDEEATTIAYESEHGALLRRESTRVEGLGDFQLQPDALALAAFQDEEGGAAAAGASHSSLAEQATNPVAALVQFQFQNVFVGETNAGDGYSNQFIVQPVIPYKLFGQKFLTRITLPLVATADFGEGIGRKYGLGDTVALNAWVLEIEDGFWKGMWGPIVTFTVPTATSDFLGEGKHQIGPGFIYINTATKKLQWGIFGYQQWSFASTGGDRDRPEVSKLFFQPFIVRHFNDGWYVASQDILWTVDFNNNTWSLPIGVRLGKVMSLGKQKVNIFVEPFYDVSTNNPGNEWGVKLNVTLLFPK